MGYCCVCTWSSKPESLEVILSHWVFSNMTLDNQIHFAHGSPISRPPTTLVVTDPESNASIRRKFFSTFEKQTIKETPQGWFWYFNRLLCAWSEDQCWAHLCSLLEHL